MTQSLSKQAPETAQAAESRRRLQVRDHPEEVTDGDLALHHQLLQGIFHTTGHLLSLKTSEGETPRRDDQILAVRTRLGSPLTRVATDNLGGRERLHAILKAAIELTEEADF